LSQKSVLPAAATRSAGGKLVRTDSHDPDSDAYLGYEWGRE
jgi:hypothetical protein